MEVKESEELKRIKEDTLVKVEKIMEELKELEKEKDKLWADLYKDIG